MTTDGFTGRKNHGRGHTYYINGTKVDGVTTIIGNGLPKPALVNWAARCAADEAVDNWDQLATLPPSQRRERLIAAPNANRDTAAVRGTRVHALADQLARGQQVHVPDELAGHVEACVRFLDDWDVDAIHTEASVFSPQWGYAGTLDLIADLGGQRWLLDWKTNRSGPFGDVAFQLAAYRYAEYRELDGVLIPMPHVDHCGVVWLRADGYDLYPYETGDDVFRQFLYIQQTARAAAASRDYKGDPITPPVRTRT
jgi:hypothetical protein